jgi:hypothetical protein
VFERGERWVYLLDVQKLTVTYSKLSIQLGVPPTREPDKEGEGHY